MIQPEINIMAVVVATIATMIIGSLWYSPLMFGNAWLKLNKVPQKEIDEARKKGMKGMTTTYVFAFIASIVMSYVLAHVAQYAGVTTVSGALQLGFWMWLGFFATTQLNMVLWEKKPFRLYLINTFHYFVSLMIMSLIVGLWR